MTFPYIFMCFDDIKAPLPRLPQGAEEVLSDSVLLTWAWPPQGLQYLRSWEWEVFPGQGQKSGQAGPRTDVRDAWPLATRSVRRSYYIFFLPGWLRAKNAPYRDLPLRLLTGHCLFLTGAERNTMSFKVAVGVSPLECMTWSIPVCLSSLYSLIISVTFLGPSHTGHDSPNSLPQRSYPTSFLFISHLLVCPFSLWILHLKENGTFVLNLVYLQFDSPFCMWHFFFFFIDEIEQWMSRGKTLATKPDVLSSIPKSHDVEGENQLLGIVLWLPQVCQGRPKPTHIHKQAKKQIIKSSHLLEKKRNWIF